MAADRGSQPELVSPPAGRRRLLPDPFSAPRRPEASTGSDSRDQLELVRDATDYHVPGVAGGRVKRSTATSGSHAATKLSRLCTSERWVDPTLWHKNPAEVLVCGSEIIVRAVRA
jgi:hypothetical protein